MAANEITFKVKVTKDGSLKVVAKDAEKAAKGTEKLGKATDETTKARNRYNRGEKGVAQAGMNTTKSFSKMRDVMGGGSSGLVGAYATLAANVFALTAAFGILQRAAAAQQLAEGLEYTGRVAGQNLPYIADRLKEITGAAVSTQEAMSAVAVATAAGFSSAQIAELAEVAKGASLALGRDMTDALNRLIRGSSKLEPELLDELGIMVRLDDAARDYATSIGRTADSLSQYEKRQAFVNKVIETGQQQFAGIAASIQPNAYDQLSAALSDLLKDSVQFINKGLAPLARFFSTSRAGLIGGVLLFTSTIRGALLPGLTQGAQRMANFAAESKAAAAASFSNVKTTGALPEIYRNVAQKIKDGTATVEDMNAAQGSLTASMSKHNRDLKNNTDLQNVNTAAGAEKARKIAQVTDAQQRLNNINILAAQAETANAKAAAINAAARLDLKGAISGIRLAMAQYTVELGTAAAANGTLSGTFDRLKVKLMGAGLAVKSLGTAFLVAMPYISLLPLAFGAIKGAWDKFFGDSDTVKKQQEIFDSLDQINEVATQLNQTLLEIERRKPPTGAYDSFLAELKASAGVASQITNTIVDAIKVQQNAKLDKITEKQLRVTSLQKQIEQGKGVTIFKAGTGQDPSLMLQEAQAELQALQDDFNNLDVAPLLKGVNKFRAILETTELDPKLLTTIKGVEEQLFSAGATIDRTKFVNMFTPSEAQQMLTQIEGIDAGMKGFLESQAKAKTAKKTPFQEMNEELVNMIDNLHKVEKVPIFTGGGFSGAPRKQTGFLVRTTEAAKELQKELTNGETKFTRFIEKFTTVGDDPVQALFELQGSLEDQLDTLATAEGNVQSFNAELKKLSETRKVDETAARRAHELEDDILEQRVAALTAQKSLFKITEIEGDKKEDIATIDAKIVALGTERKSEAQRELEIVEAIAGKKEMDLVQDRKKLDIQQKTIANAKQQAEIAKRAENEDDPNRADAKLNAKDKLTIEENLKELKIAAINDEFKIMQAMHDREYDLLDAKLGLLKEQAKGNDDLEKSLATYEQTLTDLRQAGTDSITQQKGAREAAVDEEIKQGKRTVRENVLGATGGTTAEIITAQSEAGGLGALKSTSDKFQAIRNLMGPMFEDLKKLGPEGELVAAAAQGALVIGQSWTMAFEKIGDAADGLEAGAAVASAIAATISQTASIMAAASKARVAEIDKEIAAEKKRDGKSKASQAKISQLEKKKDAEKRKAFERNKKMQMGMTIANTAAAIMQVMSDATAGPTALKIAIAMLVGAMGAAQLAIIAGSTYQGGGGGGGASMPSSVAIGKRTSSSDLSKSQSARGELAYFRGARGTGGAENFTPAFYGKKNRAIGGATGYVVGEQGPELFMPDRPGTIVPADETAEMGQEIGNVNININAIDASGVEEVLTQQQGNIIAMIRQAANQTGEDFLEDVDETTYTTPAIGRA